MKTILLLALASLPAALYILSHVAKARRDRRLAEMAEAVAERDLLDTCEAIVTRARAGDVQHRARLTRAAGSLLTPLLDRLRRGD